MKRPLSTTDRAKRIGSLILQAMREEDEIVREWDSQSFPHEGVDASRFEAEGELAAIVSENWYESIRFFRKPKGGRERGLVGRDGTLYYSCAIRMEIAGRYVSVASLDPDPVSLRDQLKRSVIKMIRRYVGDDPHQPVVGGLSVYVRSDKWKGSREETIANAKKQRGYGFKGGTKNRHKPNRSTAAKGRTKSAKRNARRKPTTQSTKRASSGTRRSKKRGKRK